MSAADLTAYVSAPSSDDTFVASCWAQATALVANFIGEATVPAEIVKRATIEVGSELFHRRQAPNGISQFASLEGTGIRVARDPLVGAYPILQPFLGVAFA